MFIYARIRSIESQELFKRFFNILLAAEYPADFEPNSDRNDGGVDGYLRSVKRVYAVYCPKYPERKDYSQYRDKITSDIKTLHESLLDGTTTHEVKEWCFVTPDDLSTSVIEHIKNKAKEHGWEYSTLTAQTLAPLFMKHQSVHTEFPDLTAGIYFDKTPSVYLRYVKNRGYDNLELFNDGTEDIVDLVVETKINDGPWQDKGSRFLYDFDSPSMGTPHSCFTLKRGERQYITDTPSSAVVHYRVSGVGSESKKTFVAEGSVDVSQERARMNT